MQNDIRTTHDARKGVMLCLDDLSAAFDTINHNTFFHRLFIRMGVQGTVSNWFRSYNEGGYQSVYVSGVSSVPQHLTFGFS